MVAAESLARFAGLLSDRTRATFCVALLDGRAWTVGELADHAGVARSTASEHVSMLVDSGILAEARQGRHRYVHLAGSDVAQVVEDVAALVGADAPAASYRAVRARRDLAAARTCYDHLAGRLGVGVCDAMVRRGLVSTDGGVAVTGTGKQWLADLGWAPDDASRRPVVRTCVDWTERRPHLGGQLGAGLCARFVALDWVRRSPGSRAVVVTEQGVAALVDGLGPSVVDAVRR